MASQPEPPPRISPWIRAPRFRACSRSSRIRIPPPRRAPSRRAGGRRAGTPGRVALPPRHVRRAGPCGPGSGGGSWSRRPGDHHVGPAPADDPRRLGDGQVGRCVGLGDRVARPLAVDQDRDVAGEHVGQVLQAARSARSSRSTRGPRPGSRRRGRPRKRGRSPAPARRARWRSVRRPRSMPIRVGSTPPSTSPASATANCAAATASWMSRAMYLRLLRSLLEVLGERVLLQVEVRGPRPPRRWAGRRRGRPRVGRTAPRPSARDVQTLSGLSPRGVTRPRPVMTTRRSEPSMKDSSIVAGFDLNGCHVLRCSPESNRLLIIAPERRSCVHKPDAKLRFSPTAQDIHRCDSASPYPTAAPVAGVHVDRCASWA